MNGNDAFLLADPNLDAKPYNEENMGVTWATCTLRTWLNDTFLNTAFTSAEQVAIKNTTVVNDDNPYSGAKVCVDTIDKVYLLSIAEANNTTHGFNGDFRMKSETRGAKNTAYAEEGGVLTDNETGHVGNGHWLLRLPGGFYHDSAAFVDKKHFFSQKKIWKNKHFFCHICFLDSKNLVCRIFLSQNILLKQGLS